MANASGSDDNADVVYLGEVKYSDLTVEDSDSEVEISDDDEERMTPLSVYRYYNNKLHAAFALTPNAGTYQHEFMLLPMTSSNPHYVRVIDMMNETILPQLDMPFIWLGMTLRFDKYQILNIAKVWNTKLLSRYTQHVQRIKEENNNEPNEFMLFHGSPMCLEIAEKGFDERHASCDGLYGAGVYFAAHSSKSNNYAKKCCCIHCPRQMLLCRVALGNIYESRSPGKFAHAPPGHHSVKGFVAAGNVIYPEYVVYRGEQAYPEYLITYRMVYRS